jgi:hypothetical protein
LTVKSRNDTLAPPRSGLQAMTPTNATSSDPPPGAPWSASPSTVGPNHLTSRISVFPRKTCTSCGR